MEKNEEEAGVDKISDLPDSILHHIFSFLNMEEAVRSSVFSKRWRHLWTSLPTLNFEYGDQDILDNNKIMGLVDKVFTLRDASNIQRFRFVCPQVLSNSSSHVSTWIVSALRLNLQELILETCFEMNFSLPTCLFNSKSLTLLKLVSIYPARLLRLPIPDSACLPSLKTLFLESMDFVDEYRVNNFFSSCTPVLESLTIITCLFDDIDFKISSLSLKHLVMEGIFWFPQILSNGNFKLKTPNLISFRCRDYVGRNYYLEDISSLIKADIYMIQDDICMIQEDEDEIKKRMLTFLGACCNVEDLTLSANILEAISYPCFLESNHSAISCPCFLHSNPAGFRNLRYLEIDASFSGDCISAITCLLKISPTIETLFVNRPKIKLDSEADLLHDMVTYQGEVSFPCLLDKLEHVEIRDAIGCGNELKFLEILLKNAKVLKNMVVYTRMEDSIDRSVRMKKFTKLLKFPRASSNITILFI